MAQLTSKEYVPLLEKMTFADVLRAIAALDDGLRTRFQAAKDWSIQLGEKKTLAHRPVVALAIRRHLDREIGPEEFSGQIDEACRERLKELEFVVKSTPN